MTKRYFYTDPLAAAWMAKHHGVELFYMEHYSDDSWPTEITYLQIISIIDRCGEDSYELEKLYIKPKSLAILEPQVGDFVRYIDALPSQGNTAPYSDMHVHWTEPCYGNEFDMAQKKQIIQRNGKAFHMPEVEDETR